MADAAMTVLLETLSHMLLSCSDLVSGAEDDLRLLLSDVESFRAFFRSLANKPKEEVAFRAMAGRIEEVVYDAQDTIDSYSIEAAQSKIDLFPGRPKAVANRRAEAVQSFREYMVRPVLDCAMTDFANMPQPNPAAVAAHAAALLPMNIPDLFAVLEGDLIPGAEEELRLLKKDVGKLTTFLQNTAYNPDYEDPFGYMVVMEWMFDELIRDAPEVINYYLSQIDLFRRRGDLHLKRSSGLAEVVRSLREDNVKPMLEQARIDIVDVLLTGDGSDSTALEEPHQIKVWFGEDTRVGVEYEQATITRYLREETKELVFISITGDAGTGKTSLAKSVYQSQEIQYEFPTRIWVTVSQNFSKRGVFLRILKEVTSRDKWSVSEAELASAVHRFLENRKFLLVLDDIWTHVPIAIIGDALPQSNPRGKILITSRMREVAGYAMPSIEPCIMRFLTEDECWELLQLQVFGGLHICPPGLIEMGRDVARHCRGVPLTVVIIGGILVDELSKTQSVSMLKKAWIEVFQYIRVDTANDGGNFIDRVIKLSYERLPDELRNLFLYLGVFPEDYEIPSATLIRLWIAEGFIQHQEGRSLEDVAEEKLKRLVRRKLVIVDKVRSDGRVKSIHLHDTVYSFCIRKGRKLNLFKKIEFSRNGILSSQVQNMHRRLYINSDPLKISSSKGYFPSARTFLCFYNSESPLLPEDTSKIPGYAFELLRVLHLKPIRFTRFPLELTRQFCLRYIVLSSDFKILPMAISNLRNIQTLVIHTSSRILEIKADVWKMIQLRHLQTNASIILREEPEDHSNQEIRTLTNLSPENCTDRVVHRARCLKKLGIRGTLPILLDGEVGLRKFDNFVKLKELENLKLLNDVHLSSPSECRLSCLPPTKNFPPKLRSLTLSATFLSWEHMSVLGMLEKLEVLKLKDNAFVRECWEVADGSFPNLQVLQIGYTNLVFWHASSHHFPRLRSLALRNCEKLEALPQGLERAENFWEMELLRPSKTIVALAKKIQVERQRMEGSLSTPIKLSIFYPPDE